MAIILNDSFEEDESKPTETGPTQPKEDPNSKGDDPTDNDDDSDIYIRPTSKKKRGRTLLTVLITAAVVLAGVFVYDAFFKEIVKEGCVRGYVLKIEQANSTFDSYEAVMVLDYPQEINDSTILVFNFSTRDVDTAKKLFTSMKNDSLVVLCYKRYNNSALWRGKTDVIAYKAECIKPKPNSRKKK